MKYAFFVLGLTFSPLSFSSEINPNIQHYIAQAETQRLDQSTTWLRLMYANHHGHSEVNYSGYFLAEQGKTDLKKEIQHTTQAFFSTEEANQSIGCKFPARSSWLMQQ